MPSICFIFLFVFGMLEPKAEEAVHNPSTASNAIL